MDESQGHGEQDTRTEYGDILMHPDEAKAIFQTELTRQILRRNISVENLQPRMVPRLMEANSEDRVKAVLDVFQSKLIKRGISL